LHSSKVYIFQGIVPFTYYFIIYKYCVGLIEVKERFAMVADYVWP